MSVKKVCVVGAGFSGLVSARELRREGHEVTVMEQNGGIGGQWLYSPRTDGGNPLGVAGVHSSIYASLRINFPRETSSFSDFPFYPKNGGGDARRYPGHGEVLNYIRNFCGAFGLMDAIRLKVVHVGLAPRGDDGVMRWVVRCAKKGADGLDEAVTAEVFDAVIVAAGHFTQPRIPSINGMDRWRRRHLHSHSYRVPDSFQDQVVLIVGCSESGMELALELHEEAREVHISVKSMDDGAVGPGMKKALSRHQNLHLQPQIDCLHEDGRVAFTDGSCVVADAIIYCTGYDYSFPFLDAGGLVTVDDNRVGPLFEHTFPPALAPSLSFVGIPSKVAFPLFYEVQARWSGGWRRCCPAGDRCHRRRRCCAPWRSTTAPGRSPACPSTTPMTSSTWSTATSSGKKHCGFPRLEEWKKELLWSSFRNLRDNRETFRDDYHDSDVVREGLRSEGWFTGPATHEKDDGGDDKELVLKPQQPQAHS